MTDHSPDCCRMGAVRNDNTAKAVRTAARIAAEWGQGGDSACFVHISTKIADLCTKNRCRAGSLSSKKQCECETRANSLSCTHMFFTGVHSSLFRPASLPASDTRSLFLYIKRAFQKIMYKKWKNSSEGAAGRGLHLHAEYDPGDS